MLRYLTILILFSFSANAEDCTLKCKADDLNKAKSEYERTKTEAAAAEAQAIKETPEFVATIKSTMKAGVDSAQAEITKANDLYQKCLKSCGGR